MRLTIRTNQQNPLPRYLRFLVYSSFPKYQSTMINSTDLCDFLSSYAAAILKAGSTTERCEKTVSRIAVAYGYVAEMTILPRSVTVSVRPKGNWGFVSMHKSISGFGVDFHQISMLSQLSWDIRDEHISLGVAKRRLRNIVMRRRMNAWVAMFFISLANASWVRLFDGDYPGVVIVFVATLCGLLLRNSLTGHFRWDYRIATLLAACCSSVLVSLAFLLDWTQTEDVALGTCVLYLVPGIMFINSVSDMINGHVLYSFNRFVTACVLTACLGLGLSLGILLMNVESFI